MSTRPRRSTQSKEGQSECSSPSKGEQSPSCRRSLRLTTESPAKNYRDAPESSDESDEELTPKKTSSLKRKVTDTSLDQSPSTPRLTTKVRRRSESSPLYQKALTSRASLCPKDILLSLERIDEDRSPPASPEKPEHTPESNSRARRRITNGDECTAHTEKEPESPSTMTPKSKRKPLKEIEAPNTPKSSEGTPTRNSRFSTPRSGKFRVDPSTPRTPIDEARANLHISAVPKSLPCRQAEFDTIYNFLIRKLESQSGGVMYISGVPGTGKTATVHKVIQMLEEEAEKSEIDPFIFVEVNALRISEPRQAYVKILKDLTGDLTSAPNAQALIEKRFCRPAKKATIILVDELDYLCNRRQDVIYNILDWTTKQDSRLIVLTIANTMDLPERTLKGRVTSRMGLTRLMFQPYTHDQLQEIVMNRLDKFKVIHPDAVQLVSRKVAAVSGDARRALDICRRATEFVDEKMCVKIEHVQKVLNNIFKGPRVMTIQNCSEIEKLILRSLRDESQRTGVEETHLKKMYRGLSTLCSLEALYVPDIGSISYLCTKLSNMGLIIAENSSSAYLYRKLVLNVSVDDLHFALNC